MVLREKMRAMRWLAAVLVLSACSSSGIVSQEIEGGPGQAITVGIANVEVNELSTDRQGVREYDIEVEVRNNSDLPETVTRITIKSDGSGPFQVQPSSQTFNEIIDPGKDHLFKVRVRGQLVRDFQFEERKVVELRCIVSLANGDSYYYTFEGPVRI